MHRPTTTEDKTYRRLLESGEVEPDTSGEFSMKDADVTETGAQTRRKRFGISLGQDLKSTLGLEECPTVKTAADVADAFSDLAALEREVIIAGAIDCQCRLVCWNLLAVGRNDMLVMRVGDAFVGAIRSGASGIFLVHNHPSGLLEPSDEDLRLTRDVAEAGLLLGYNLLDHVIISRSGFRSLLDRNFMRTNAKRLNITNAVLRESDSGRCVTEWRCMRCKSKNSHARYMLRSVSKQSMFLPSRCAYCGSFAWLKSGGQS
jgi:DNA repair protein RadC